MRNLTQRKGIEMSKHTPGPKYDVVKNDVVLAVGEDGDIGFGGGVIATVKGRAYTLNKHYHLWRVEESSTVRCLRDWRRNE